MEGYRVEEMTPLKKCTKCGEEKPGTKEFFYAGRHFKGGIRSTCKECDKQYNITNIERIHERKRDYYQQNRAILLDKSNKFNSTHREYCEKYRHLYRQRNKECLNKKNNIKRKRERSELSDWYIRALLKNKYRLNNPSAVPHNVIELKRIHMDLIRKKHEGKNKQSVNS